MSISNKLIVILGPTASGKTELSIKLAKKFSGEIVSADSRQIYKGMDIGSGKITKKEMKGIPHHLLDVANPKTKFTASQYQKLSKKIIKNIQKRNRVPLLVGGSPFYIQSVAGGILIPEITPNWKLRKKLEKLSIDELFNKLKKLDPKRAGLIDRHNPRRLIRALEIVLTTGKPVPSLNRSDTSERFNVLKIGIKKSPEELEKSIHKRLLKRLKNNAMINEVKKLRKSGLSFKRLEEFGLEYRFIAQYLQNKVSYKEMAEKIQRQSERLAKKQMAWFKKDKQIHWVKNYKEAGRLLKKFLKIDIK